MKRGGVERIFDVGCGCGYLLKAAKDMGMYASGNDLNGYAVGRMKDVLGLDVHSGVLYDLVQRGVVKTDYFDLVYMNDYIEHTYHPKLDIEAAFKMLRGDGVIYLQTFCVDSERFERLKEKWDMLMWNHCFHFSSVSLKKIAKDSGFEIVSCHVDGQAGMVEILARKPAQH